MIEKILKDIKGLFKVQDKAKFLKRNIPYLANRKINYEW